MSLYAGFDLHAKSNHLAILDQKGKRVFSKKLPNETKTIFEALKPFKKRIEGLVVESTYNWYWLVDSLMEKGYRVHLANPSAIQQYRGLKHSDDVHDAFWLADQLRLGVLPEGYIYPKEERPSRDLLRKRGHLVRLRTSLIISLQNIIDRNLGFKVNVKDIKRLRENRINPLLAHNEDLALVGQTSKRAIDFLTRQILDIEKVVESKIKIKPPYEFLLTLPGVGKILGLTIMLETGPISRFSKVGHYASYCRKVTTRWSSNGKSKGKGNKKNGNRYLAWAFSEAAELSKRYDPYAKRYFTKKALKTNRMVAHNALAHKLARAAYWVMKAQVPFSHEKLFA